MKLSPAGLLVLLLAPAASAAPQAPLCVPADPQVSLRAAHGEAIACWQPTGDCLALERRVAVPRPALRRPEVRDDHGALAACNGARCTRLGPQLAAAVTAARDRLAKAPELSLAITVTTDLALVAIDLSATDDPITELWSVAKDGKVAVKKPAVYGKTGQPTLIDVEAVGDLAFASWTDCAGPCTKEIAVDASGTNHSKAFEAGGTAVLPDGRFVVAGETGRLQILDANGRHGDEIATHLEFGMVAVLGASDVVVLGLDPAHDGYAYVHVTVPARAKPALGAAGVVHDCAP